MKMILSPQRSLPLPPKQKPAGKPFSVCPHRLGRREGAGCSVKIPGLPGEGTVTDGSVDWYEMDWENVDNGVTEEQMPRNVDRPCTAQDPCTDNSPVQTDDETYEIVQE